MLSPAVLGLAATTRASADEQAMHIICSVVVYLLSVSGTGHTVRGSPVSKGVVWFV